MKDNHELREFRLELFGVKHILRREVHGNKVQWCFDGISLGREYQQVRYPLKEMLGDG